MWFLPQNTLSEGTEGRKQGFWNLLLALMQLSVLSAFVV